MNLAVLKADARAVAQRQQERISKAIDEDRDMTAEEETADADDKAKLARLVGMMRPAAGSTKSMRRWTGVRRPD